jgi:hypothetical protein
MFTATHEGLGSYKILREIQGHPYALTAEIMGITSDVPVLSLFRIKEKRE